MDQAEQARALAETAGVRRREDLLSVRVTGDDAVDWLNGQVTNDVRRVAQDGPVYALAVNVRGKIMADVWVLQHRQQLTVLLPTRSADTVLASFDAQIIMEDVELVRAPEVAVISVQGPAARRCAGDALVDEADVLACDELGHGGVFVVCQEAQAEATFAALCSAAEQLGGGQVHEAGAELARLRAARPRFGLDFDERHYPQEAGLKERAVSFQKGCYLGQEVVCTLENRGKLRRRLTVLRSESDATLEPGLSLSDADGSAVGELTSTVRDPSDGAWLALGYVKTAAAAHAKLHTTQGDVVVLAPTA